MEGRTRVLNCGRKVEADGLSRIVEGREPNARVSRRKEGGPLGATLRLAAVFLLQTGPPLLHAAAQHPLAPMPLHAYRKIPHRAFGLVRDDKVVGLAEFSRDVVTRRAKLFDFA